VTATATETVTSSATSTGSASAAETPSETVTPSEVPTPTVTPTESAAAGDGSPGAPWWVWLLLATVVAGVIGWFVFAASRRRKWDAAFAIESMEARWFTDTLVPSITDRTVSTEEIVQRWTVSQRRLDDMQTQLATLAATATGTRRSGHVARVSAAAVALRQALASDVALRSGTDVGAGSQTYLVESRGAVQRQSDALLAAIDDRP